MNNHIRLTATRYIWVTMGISLFSLFLSAGIANGLEATHVILGIAICIAGFLSTGMVWNWGDVGKDSAMNMMDDQEKVKRERIDGVLRDLSNEELVALKKRLSDGTMDDDLLYERMSLSDDGELIAMNDRK